MNDPGMDTAYPYLDPYRNRGLDLGHDRDLGLEIGLEILSTVGIYHLSDGAPKASSAARCDRFFAERGLLRLLQGDIWNLCSFARVVLNGHSRSYS